MGKNFQEGISYRSIVSDKEIEQEGKMKFYDLKGNYFSFTLDHSPRLLVNVQLVGMPCSSLDDERERERALRISIKIKCHPRVLSLE